MSENTANSQDRIQQAIDYIKKQNKTLFQANEEREQTSTHSDNSHNPNEVVELKAQGDPYKNGDYLMMASNFMGAITRPVSNSVRNEFRETMRLRPHIQVVTGLMLEAYYKNEEKILKEQIQQMSSISVGNAENALREGKFIEKGGSLKFATDADIRNSSIIASNYLDAHGLKDIKNTKQAVLNKTHMTAAERDMVNLYRKCDRHVKANRNIKRTKRKLSHAGLRISTQVLGQNQEMAIMLRGVRYTKQARRAIRGLIKVIHKKKLVSKLGSKIVQGVGAPALSLFSTMPYDQAKSVMQNSASMIGAKLNKNISIRGVMHNPNGFVGKRVLRVTRKPGKQLRLKPDNKLRKIVRKVAGKGKTANSAVTKFTTVLGKPFRILLKPFNFITKPFAFLQKLKLKIILYAAKVFLLMTVIMLQIAIIPMIAVALMAPISTFFTRITETGEYLFSEQDVDPMDSIGYIVYSEVTDLENDFLTSANIDATGYDDVQVEYVNAQGKKANTLPNNIKDILSMSSVFTEKQTRKDKNFKEYSIDLWKASHNIVKKEVKTTHCDTSEKGWEDECTNVKGKKCGGHKTLIITLGIKLIPTKENKGTDAYSLFKMEEKKKLYNKYMDTQKKEKKDEADEKAEEAADAVDEEEQKRVEAGKPGLTTAEETEIRLNHQPTYRLFEGWTKENKSLAQLRASANWKELYGIDIEETTTINTGFQMVSGILKYLKKENTGKSDDSVASYYYVNRPRALVLKYAFSRIGITPYSQGGVPRATSDGKHELAPKKYPRALPEFAKKNDSADCSAFVSWVYAKMLKDVYSGINGKVVTNNESYATELKQMGTFSPHTTSTLGTAFNNTKYDVSGAANIRNQMQNGKIQAGDILNTPGRHAAIFLRYNANGTMDIIEEGGNTPMTFVMNGKKVHNVGICTYSCTKFTHVYKIINFMEDQYKKTLAEEHKDKLEDLESTKCPWKYPFRFITSGDMKEDFALYGNVSDYTHWTSPKWKCTIPGWGMNSQTTR